MQTAPTPYDRSTPSLAAYEAARRGGAPPRTVRVELEIPPETGARFEGLFCKRVMRGDGDPALPKYAHHHLHVAAVMAQGGYPALSERRIGKDGVCVCLPLIQPSLSPLTTEA